MSTTLRDHHATIFVPPALAGPIEAIRLAWDPVMAQQIAAHVTLVYPGEIPEPDVLAARLSSVAATAAPFSLRLGPVACFGRPEDGIYVAVDDDGGYRHVRTRLLRISDETPAFPAHVTLIHPRTSPRGRAFWNDTRPLHFEGAFVVTEIALTAFDGSVWRTLETLPLAGRHAAPAVEARTR